MTDALLSDSDLGLSYPSSPSTSQAPDDGSGDLVVHPSARIAPPPVQSSPPAAPTSDTPKAPSAPALLSDADLGLVPGPDAGPLTNAPDDGWLSGAAKGLGTAAVKAVGNTAGFVGGLGDFADYLVARGEHAVTGKPVDTILADMAKAKHDQEAHAASTFGIPSWTDPRNVFPTPAQVSDPILKKTGDYAPTSELGRLAQTGAEAVLSSVGPGAGAKAGTYADVLRGAATMAPGNFVGGAAAQGATDLTGDPLIGTVAGFTAPIAAHGALAGVEKVAGPALASIPEKTPIVGPAINNAVENAAARRVMGAASDPVAAKAAILGFDPASSEVPGTTPTTAAVANDPRLLQAEMTARGPGGANVEFNDRDAVQNSARIAALNSTQPSGDVFRPGQFIRQNLDAVDAAAQRAQDQLEAAHAQAVAARAEGNQAATDRLTQSFQAAHDQLTQAAQNAAAPLGEPVNAEDLGATLRTAQQEATNAAKQAKNRMYDAVDPEGTLATVVSPLREAKVAIQKAIDPHFGTDPSGAEGAIWSQIDRMPDIISFRSLRELDSKVTAAMAEARKTPNAQDPQALGRLTQLKSAVMDTIHNAADHQAAHEARLVQERLMPAEVSLESRLRDFAGLENAEPIGGRATGTNSAVGFFPGARPLQSGRAGQASRPNLPPVGRAPQSLVAFLRQAGGLKEFGGELSARELHRQFPGIVNNRSGLPLDMARRAAAEAGYLGADTAHAVANTDVNDLLSAIDNHPVYSVHDFGRVMDREQNATLRDMQRSYKSAAGEIRDNLRASGVDPRSAPAELVHDAAVLMTHDRLPWHEALATAGENLLQDQLDSAREAQFHASQEQGYNDPAYGDAGARSPETGDTIWPRGSAGNASEARPNFDEAAAERLSAAKAAHVDYVQTHKNPIVKGALQTNGFVGQYTSPTSAIPNKWVVKGDKVFETANAYLAASGNHTAAIEGIQQAVLNPLRRGALTNGTIHPNGLARWKQDYSSALRAIDAVSPGFSDRFDTAAHATQAVLDAGMAHEQQVREFQRQSAADALTANAASKASMNAGLAGIRDQLTTARNSPAGKFAHVAGKTIAPAEVENTIGGMLKTGTGGAARMRELVQSVSADPEALEGLRKAAVDWMVRTHLGATEAGASGEKQMKGAPFISFVASNRDVLKELFTHAQLSMFGAVGRSIETDAKWIAATTAKNGPGTAKDLAPKLNEGVKDAAKHGSMMFAAMEGLEKGYEIGGLKGVGVAAALPAAYLVNVLRGAGLKRIEDVYTKMLIDPDFAKTLLSKMPTSMESSTWHSLTRAARRVLITGPIAQREAATGG